MTGHTFNSEEAGSRKAELGATIKELKAKGGAESSWLVVRLQRVKGSWF